jgi:uncharacterized alkaline shock family protein YloU
MPNIRMGMALTGFLLILINISIAQLSIGNLQKHKTIAFENPHGQVTLSLSAIEDYIKKITGRLPEIRDVRTNITAGKTGIDITARLALYSDINIPEATDKIQNMIRARLQEMLGIEEKVTIRVHVAKIVQREKAKIDKHESSAIRHAGFKGEIEYGG